MALTKIKTTIIEQKVKTMVESKVISQDPYEMLAGEGVTPAASSQNMHA